MNPIGWTGETSLLMRFSGDLPVANRAALDLYGLLAHLGFAEVRDLIPGARTLLIELVPGSGPSSELRAALATEPPPSPERGREHQIPVRYNGKDLGEIAASAGLTTSEAAALHASGTYRVAFLGFSPGFAYLTGLPAELHAARLGTPRARVPAGSVAIGGTFTGIYPRATPGGWRLIGHTDAVLFDLARIPASTLRPGDRVRFRPA